MRMGRARILVLPIAAVVIAGLCAFKLTRTYPTASAETSSAPTAPVPPRLLFELLDAHKPSELVRLQSYLGRHRILVVFYDGQAGADRDPNLLKLRENYDTLHALGTMVLAVSTALPQENRKVFERAGEFPFALLSDPDFSVHQAWGRFDEQARKPLSGAFFIDRKGDVAWQGGHPQPLANPAQVIDRLLRGS